VTLRFNTPAGVSATAMTGATATPGQMKFTACGVDQSVKFSASSAAVPGNHTVTADHRPEQHQRHLQQQRRHPDQGQRPRCRGCGR
jgi:hypothetical protein